MEYVGHGSNHELYVIGFGYLETVECRICKQVGR